MEQEESFLKREVEGNGDEVVGCRMVKDKRKKREMRLAETRRNWFC